jgi:histidine ammonia-lyase
LQRNLILSHCAGVGDAMPPHCPADDDPEAALAGPGRLWGALAGDRADTSTCWQRRDAGGAGQGSVGASGDLAPLAHMAAVMMGEGEAEFGGKVMPGADALKAAGLSPSS